MMKLGVEAFGALKISEREEKQTQKNIWDMLLHRAFKTKGKGFQKLK